MSSEYFRLGRPVVKAQPEALAWKTQLMVFLLAFVVVISRRPDAILNAQFFAEDGMFWYADAYNMGWFHALLVPHTGYFQTLPRLSAALSLLLPLQFAPLLLNLVAIVVQILPVNVLVSSRCASWAPINARILMAVGYLAIPNSRELDAAITEAQWHMALLAALVVLSVPAVTRLWKLFDVTVILLSGLTGPFCLALLPIALLIWLKRRRFWNMVLAGLLACCSAVQFNALTTTAGATRSPAVLGATPTLFWRMLVGDVYGGAILGQNHFASRSSFIALLLAGALATAIVVYCFLKTSIELKLFLLYCFLLYAASLRNPMISLDKPQWQVLEDAPGLRYWFFPMLGFVWAAIWCAVSGPIKQFRVAGVGVLVLMILGIAKDWIYPAYSDNHFRDYVRRFEALAPGQAMIFPLYPDGWTMQLTKKGKICQSLPTGFLDEPKDHATVARSTVVRGWVNSSEPNPQVSILVDGVLAQSLSPGVPRPDVDKIYGVGPVKDKGWQAALDLKAAPGTHRIEVHARSSSGCEAVLGISSVEVAR